MKLSLVPKSTPLTLETSEGDVELFITKFTVADAEFREELMSSTWKDDSIPDYSKLNRFNIARMMCAVKDKDGNYFFTGSIDDVRKSIAKEIIEEICKEVDVVNPIAIPTVDDSGKPETALNTKKKKS